MKRLLFILLLSGFADASCQGYWDYCFTATVTNHTIFDLRSITTTNVEGQSYVNQNMSNVNISLITTSGTWSMRRYGTPDYPMLLVYANSSGSATLRLCLNGSTSMSSLNASVFDTSGASYPVQPISINDFTSYYRRNWTFRYESNGSIYNFTGHNATLTVNCGSLSSFSYNLSTLAPGSTLTLQTQEQPKFSMVIDGAERTRNEPDNFLREGYYVLTPGSQYKFNLVDYTGQCNGLLKFQKSISDVYGTMYSGYFGLERDAYATLDNATSYRVTINCKNGGIRDFGIVTLGGTLTRNIEVTNIDLSQQTNIYEGGLRMWFDTNTSSSIMALNFGRDSGLIDMVNFTVYDMNQTPLLLVYQSIAYNTSGGSMNYNIGNQSHTYYLTAVAINNGMTVTKSESSTVYNPNSRLVDLGIPSTIMGVSDTTIYKGFALIVMVILGLGFSAIDAGYAAVIMVAWIMLMSWIRWLDVPAWLEVVIGLLALGLLWGMNRRHDD